MRKIVFLTILVFTSCKSVDIATTLDYKIECKSVDNDEICIYRQFEKRNFFIIGFKEELNNRIGMDTLQIINLKRSYSINIGSISIDGMELAVVAIEDTLNISYNIDSSQAIVKSWIYNPKSHLFCEFDRRLIRFNEGYYER